MTAARDLMALRRRSTRERGMTCDVPGCDRQTSARGWCNLHYQRWRAHGDPHWTPLSPEQRFWARVDDRGECWLWIGALHCGGKSGYGWTGSKLAHRAAFEFTHGRIPDGLQLDHICRMPSLFDLDESA